MSLILDALNRSRQDAEQVPGLATPHFVEGPPAKPRWRQALPWVGLVLALLVIAWLLLDRSGGEGAAGAAGAGQKDPAEQMVTAQERQRSVDDLSVGPGANTDVAPASSPTALSSGERLRRERASRAAARPPPRPQQSELVPGPQLPRAAAGPQPEDAGAAEPPAAPAPAAASAESDAVARLYQRSPQTVEPVPAEPAVAAKSTPAGPAPSKSATARSARAKPAAAQSASPGQSVESGEQPVDIGEILAKAEQELENARLQEHPAPFLADLSQQAKDAIPTLMYQRHDYAEAAGQASVVINGASVRAGGSVSGVRVDEILPGSVVLSHQGTQFRLRALNSWVNL